MKDEQLDFEEDMKIDEDALDVEWSISATGSGILQKINESDNGKFGKFL